MQQKAFLEEILRKKAGTSVDSTRIEPVRVKRQWGWGHGFHEFGHGWGWGRPWGLGGFYGGWGYPYGYGGFWG
ncbi:sulfur globule protein TR2 domain protein [Ancylostoma duodenale]|uniref:Sulfur globule protein TR2 domain protein n=1 Tax=Ancylostoma duodenale TaxID=51022 RepID=A0A0C2D0F8_9BILA|nr:sulfur globule protein TR2 domain protein [Ancylostoma duodenale]